MQVGVTIERYDRFARCYNCCLFFRGIARVDSKIHTLGMHIRDYVLLKLFISM